ncbi:FAD-binding and (Fe-S)-binding domain-containing protein [Nocardioides sp. YIM 152315]|uniref:FAD-binding and (Fe-S)-binding domain-containing protein n=1 Tax=Nocardioides sp. YIM 152315 TaxID=3031760 RepID=UPI0023D9860E|nr:FAD-binding and (Fe-S)-binding domain-containing protein [Nocardioides sp. YIM 152315]MDF1605815.1 FAD-binding and (Fe-S)-binding domain-containing protein [Nocardioides sp. YIM 152315]
MDEENVMERSRVRPQRNGHVVDWTGLEMIETDLDRSRLTRSLYASDAGLHRIVPEAIAYPQDEMAVARTLEWCRTIRVAVTPRGTGTSCAGNAIGPGLIVDFTRHMTNVVTIDADAKTATIEPGVVQADLQRQAAGFGLRFGPDPSTSDRCTVGGMIGNNACGPRALGYGRTADNIVALRAIAGTGELLVLDDSGDGAGSPLLASLRRLVMDNLALIRTEFGRFSRQVSGYSLEHLLPENGFNVARFLAGTEGTLAVVTEATVRLVEDAPHKLTVVLGYSSMPDAADDAPLLATAGAVAAEGLDRRIVDVVRRRQGSAALPPLPDGDAWMFVELVGDDLDVLNKQAANLIAASRTLEGWAVEDPAIAAAIWRVRADGAGLAEQSLDAPAYGGWEDAAVPPEALGAYLREFEDLLGKHDMHALPYGHFGEGCVHCRIDFPLTSTDGADRYRSFVEDAARLVARYGGSMSGEHGDGRARSAVLGQMYSAEALQLMAAVKAIFDPDNILNPGIIVDPEPLGTALRAPSSLSSPLALLHPEFAAEVHRCSGVGKCLVNGTSAGRVMCPSYQATGAEKDSTRGRARLLQELVNGEVVESWRSPEVAEALDLCLSCKGCSRDCPTGVDMATYKSIATEERYRRRLRPRAHYALGWLPRWARLVTALRLGPVVNRFAGMRLFAYPIRWLAGIDQRRGLPRFASSPRRSSVVVPAMEGTPIAIWVDSFSDSFEGDSVSALVTTLQGAGYAPTVIREKACCGLTWISTGQREAARRQLLASLDVLHPFAAQRIRIVGLEPSCLATWRSDALELIGDDPRTSDVVRSMSTLAEALLQAPNWSPPDLSGTTLVAQPHCHHSSVLGWDSDAELLRRTGATVQTLGGCCGLAGNFGVEAGHYEVSVAVAEHDLLPAVREAPEALVLADGFSCRLQLHELAGRDAVTMAILLSGSAQVPASTQRKEVG